jgi:hypothetical protein
MKDVFDAAINEIKNNRNFVISTVTRTQGSTPQKPGAKLLVREDGSGVGTLGGGCVEGDIWFASTHPPPKVPTPEPSSLTSNFAPGFCGVDPCVLVTVEITKFLLFFISFIAASKTSFIRNLHQSYFNYIIRSN